MPPKPHEIRYPTEVTPHVGIFDRMAEAVHRFVSSAVYFVVGSLVLVLALGAAGLAGFPDSWVRGIGLILASLTFLMVAILENGARRSNLALQHKLNAHSRALLELVGSKGSAQVRRDLQHAIGVEERESAAGVRD